MTHTVLFLGLPIIGLLFYRSLLRSMSARAITEPPSIPLFFVFAAYGAVLLFVVSECFHVWSAMHSLAVAGLFVVGMPWLLIQSFLWRRTWTVSAYHRATIALSFAFPVTLALLVAFAFAVDR